MLILPLLFSLIAVAEENSSERYCFSNQNEALVAQSKFKAGLQVPSDSVNLEENCLMIQMRPHRRELVQRYFLSTFPSTQITFSSAEVKRDPCLLKIEKVRKDSNSGTNIDISQNSSIMHSQKKQTAGETFQVQTLKEFELSVDQNEIKGECRYINPNRYEITLEVAKKPKPLIPTDLPPGTIVTISEMPQDQKTSVLKTTLQLNRGEKIDVGSVISKLDDESNSADISPKLENETSSQILQERVFLSLD